MALVGLFKEKYIVSIDIVSIHRSCSIYLFDMMTENRLGQGTKIGGKAFDMAIIK